MNKSLKTALIIGGVILAILIIWPTVQGSVSGWQGGGWGMMGPGMMGGFGGMMNPGMIGGINAMWLLWIVLLGIIIWAAVTWTRSATSGSAGSSDKTDSASEILKKRYARGEINKEEYEGKKRDLT